MEQLIAIAEEQLRWQRAAVLPQVRQTVADTLLTAQQRKAYELHDGSMPSSEIATDVGISKQGMSGWTRRWRDLGIAYEVSTAKGTRIKHLTTLRALGLELEVPDDRAK